MAITSTGYQTPATERVGLKPSVYDKIIMIGSDETPILTKLGKSKVNNIEHSWIIDSLAEPKKNAQLEISDFDGNAKSTKQKRRNAVQILTTEVAVSETMQAVATYGGKELAHEVAKKAKEHKRDLEFAILGLGRDNDPQTSILKAPVVRDEATPGEMAGIFYFLTKTANTFTNGKRGNIFDFGGESLDEDKLNQILQNIWEAGATPKDVFIGAELKKAINKMATRQFGNEKMINSSVVSLDTDFGKVNFRLHRYFKEAYGLGGVLLAGDFDFAKIGLLKPTILTQVPTSKTAIQKRYYTEATLEIRNADAFAAGFNLKA